MASDNEWRVVLDLVARGIHVHSDVFIGYAVDIVLWDVGREPGSFDPVRETFEKSVVEPRSARCWRPTDPNVQGCSTDGGRLCSATPLWPQEPGASTV